MKDHTGSGQALIALLLLVPAPTLGVVAGMVLLPDTALGTGLFLLSKFWILAIPLIWHRWVYRQGWSWSPVPRGGLKVGLLLGLGIGLFIVTVFALLGDRLIDVEVMRNTIRKVGLDSAPVYLGGALYWIAINSLLEEYVWRWFVVQESEKLLGGTGAILISGLGFTLHHLVALGLYLSWIGTALCGLGIFAGASIWSWCYIRYRSVWPGYVSHALADISVFGIGYWLIFKL